MPSSRQQNWKFVTDNVGNKIEVPFQQWCCHVVMERYTGGGGLSLRLVDADDASSIARATVNLASMSPAADQVFIKNYTENDGVLEALVDAELIADTGRTIQSEYATLNVAQLCPLLEQQWHRFRDDLNERDKHQRR